MKQNQVRVIALLCLLLSLFPGLWAQSLQNKTYDYGLMPSNRSGQDAQNAYNTWKTNFASSCSNGRYRVKFDDPNQTVSEGIGYGMLLSAYAGDKTLFDGFWNYYKDNRNGNGVMNWKISGCSGTAGANGATDADEDAAMALIIAHYQWGSTGAINYQSDAKALINAIKSHEVESGSYVIKPGDQFGGSNLVNPSYFAPAYYKVFGSFTNDATFWNNVASKCYDIINKNLSVNNATGGIVSDWCRADGSYSGDASGYYQGGRTYYYDACRTPWRISVDYVWNGDANAQSYSKKSSDFVRVNLGGSKNVKDGYYQSGSSYGSYHNSAFTGGFACAAMGGGNQSHLDNSYSDLKGLNDGGSYFNQSLKTLYLFLLTGNFYKPGSSTTPPPPPTQGPYGGTAWPIPGKIEAENYDVGGEGVAYHDSDGSNSGGAYRTDAVDVETTSDAGGGYDVGWTAVDEWLEYTVNVKTPGKYDFNLRVASTAAGKSFHVEMNSANVTGAVAVPNTGDWQTFQTVSVKGISLSAGTQVMRIYMDTDGFNINYVDIASSSVTPPPPPTQGPYGGTAWPIPGKIEAENYDTGGESIAYHDADATNNGGAYRTDGVDIEASSDAGAGYDIGWTAADEWLEYTVNVAAAGKYDFEFRVASTSTGKSLHVEMNGTNVTGSIAIPNTGDWQAWQTVTMAAVSLNAGSQVMRIVMETDGFNINYVNVKSTTSQTPPNQPPVVSITAPANNASYTAPASVSITASASDADGSISKVEFYSGATKLGESLTSPYSFTWNNVAAGSYALNAKATDDKGAVTTSAAVNVIVNNSNTTSNCIAEAVPTASQWILTNDWTDQNNGSGLANTSDAMKITQRQWGENLVWIIESGKKVAITNGLAYTVSFDFLNDPSNPVSSIDVGFATGYAWNGPVLAQPAVSTSSGYSSSTYTTKTVTINATTSGSMYLSLKLNWTSQPNQQVNTYLKNIKVCGTAVAPKMAVNSTVLSNNAAVPNPFINSTTINIKDDITVPVNIVVSNMSGIVVYHSDVNTTNEDIYLGSEFPQGVYFVQASYEGKTTVFKIIKN